MADDDDMVGQNLKGDHHRSLMMVLHDKRQMMKLLSHEHLPGRLSALAQSRAQATIRHHLPADVFMFRDLIANKFL